MKILLKRNILLFKRVCDLIISSLVIFLILSWFTIIIGILIKLTSRGSVFFIQKRTGKNNVEFNCIKFRSMIVNSNSDKLQAGENDSRITPIGRFLRKYSLDEFPQFINVFLGDMSIIGPRPHMLLHTENYSKVVDSFHKRALVKPGITGLSQVLGYRGEIKDEQMIRNRVRLDIFYIRHWSLKLEIKIILITIRLMMFGK